MTPFKPTPSDAAMLERKRAELDTRLSVHASRLSRAAAGNASEATRRVLARNRHLSQVLAGPVALGPARSYCEPRKSAE